METISNAEREELHQLERYRSFLDLGWDANQAWDLARTSAPLRPPKSDAPSPPSKLKGKRPDAADNERKMRAAMRRRAKANGWFGGGVRELAREAGIPHKTADDALKRMEAEGQVERDRRKDKRGNRHGFRAIREHPAWSEDKPAHLLERLDASLQVEA